MCRVCGAIVGAGQDECAVCGASVTAVPASQQRQKRGADGEAVRFARAVLDRPYKFTIILLVANFFVFLLMWQSSGMTSQTLWLFDQPVLEAYGAKLNWLINERHEWWRFVTPMFVHVGLLHLLINMYSLWIVGPYVEKLYGSAKFVLFWVSTGIAAVVASYLTVVDPGTPMNAFGRFLFKTQDLPSAGASGALFGLVGVLFVFGIKFRHELPEGFKRAFGTGLLPMIAINLFIGYLGRGLFDNAAHIGGLLSGAALALVVDYRRPGEKPTVALIWRLLQIASLAVVAVSFLKLAQRFQDLPTGALTVQPVPLSSARIGDFIVNVKAMNDAAEAFHEATMNNNPAPVGPIVKALESAPHLDKQSDELKETLKTLLNEATGVTARPVPSSERERTDAQRKQTDLMRAFDSWSRDYDQWLRTNGKVYGGLTSLTPGPPEK